MTHFSSTGTPPLSGLSGKKVQGSCGFGLSLTEQLNVAFKALPQFHAALGVSSGGRLSPPTDTLAVGSTRLPDAACPVEKDSSSFL